MFFFNNICFVNQRLLGACITHGLQIGICILWPFYTTENTINFSLIQSISPFHRSMTTHIFIKLTVPFLLQF